MADPLASSWAKFHWANRHMDTLDKALARSFDPDRHTISLKTDVRQHVLGATAVTSISGLPRIRDDCGLSLGDVLQNFRAALDYLAWDLVRLGSDPHPKNPTFIQFPTHNSARDFNQWLGRRLPGVDTPLREVVREYQPYRSGDRPKAIKRLRDLSDKDKHRVLVPTVMNAEGILNLLVAQSWPMIGITYLIEKPRALNVGTKVLRIEMTPGVGECHLDVEGQFKVFPSLGYGRDVGVLVGSIRDTVLEILTRFDEML